MAERDATIRAFLAARGWGAAERRPLAGDASLRRYERLHRDGETAVLMDAPPDSGEDVRAFLSIARHLSGGGFGAPRVLAADEGAGLLLLEDLGDALFARVLERAPDQAERLYSCAIDTLFGLQRLPPPTCPAYDAPRMASLGALAHHWYGFGLTGTRDAEATETFRALLETVLRQHTGGAAVLALRDFHAENLIWLPEREGVLRVGVLDFQDAALCHPAYDLVSLLKDARRDVAPELEEAMLQRFIALGGGDPDAFRAAYCVLGAQRNLRILGVFARLSLHYGKPHYVDLIPRVWGHLMASLAHPSLGDLAERVARDLPPPDPAGLALLKAKCATVPMP